MYYRVERTYLTDEAGRAQTAVDRRPYMIVADTARDAALVFVTHDGGQVVGTISDLTGDKATATAVASSRMYVIFVERGAESIDRQAPGSANPSRDRELR